MLAHQKILCLFNSEINISDNVNHCYVMLCYNSGIWRILTTTRSRPRVFEALADLQTSIPAPTPSLVCAKRDPPGPMAGPYRPKTREAMSYLWKALGALQQTRCPVFPSGKFAPVDHQDRRGMILLDWVAKVASVTLSVPGSRVERAQ